MPEIKTTSLLAELIENAKKIGNNNNHPLTAERFVVAVIDKAMQNECQETDEELANLKYALESTIADPVKAKEMLLAYICSETTKTFLDDLYMKKQIQEALSVAVDAGKEQLSAISLFFIITSEPGKTLKEVLERTGTKSKHPYATNFDVLPQTTATHLWKDNRGDMLANSDMCIEENNTSTSAKNIMSSLVSEAKRIREELHQSIYGQDNAVNVFVTGYFQAGMLSVIDKARKSPRATFLFAGPPGVGKTFLAEKAADALKLPFMRFDMSEYSDKEANLEFCGSDKVYKNAKAGNVTSFVEANPRCVLLFDEIEKAHLCVIHLFLQMLDAGRLRDNFTDREVSFSETIIIFTTNAGKQLYEESENGDFSSVSRKVIVKALHNDVNAETGTPYFPAAICSRFASGNVVMFNRVGAHDLRMIAKKEIGRHVKELEKESGIHFEIDDLVYTAILFAEGSSADARTVKSRAKTFFNDELYELLRLIASEKAKSGINDIESIKVSLDLSNAEPEISGLFTACRKTTVLMLASKKTVSVCKKKAPDFVLLGAQSFSAAVDIIKENDIDFVALDMRFGASADSLYSLNIEDVKSPACELFKFLSEQRNTLPIYLLEESDTALSEEERISFERQGVRDVICVSDDKDSFFTKFNAIASNLHQQVSMEKLSRENKLVSFGTAQIISEDGKNAEIKLFDFKMSVAVDSEDSGSILSITSKPDVHFDDVIGAHDAKKELTYFVEYLKNPKKYMGTGVKAPKGVLLYGPPGTGKTMLAKAMACESGVTFIAAEGNQFLKKYVGEGSEKIHKLFRTARKYAPSILFIDEIDAIAKERKGAGAIGVGSEETLTALLTEMDGFASDPSRPVFVLAATNFDVEPGGDRSLDSALMRRFDRRVYIDLPDRESRIKFLEMKIANNKAMDISQDQIDNIAMRSMGMSLDELDSAIELALRSAIRAGSTIVTDSIFEEAFETFNSGEVKKWDTSQLERIARHEAGHALLCWMSGETPSYLTIVARGNHGGYMQHAENEGKAIYTKDELLDKIRTSLGGRAAEIVYYGEKDGISTGASGDLSAATGIAQQIVCTYGMDEQFGIAVVDGDVAANGMMSVEVRSSVNRILNEQITQAIRIIGENKDKIDSLVEELMAKNHLSGIEIEKVLVNSDDE